MNILVTGASGLVGSALVPYLRSSGHTVVKLVRVEPKKPDEIYWDPESRNIDSARLTELDAVIHLAGESIAKGRWTPEKKQRILKSRVEGTRFLAESIARMDIPPLAMVCASAVGYYGDRGSEILKEESPPGTGFLPEVCVQWEAAADPARQRGIRVVNTRFGIILSAIGGALAQMLMPFRMGAGGRLGSGEQYFSWIVLDDVLGTIHHVLNTETLNGPVNTVAPNPVTNREFTSVLGRVLRRPTVLMVPTFAARLAFGEMADSLLLASTRVDPTKLIATKYPFMFPDLEGALYHALTR
jgi:uncharacterized protein (TIGR01777 family)